MNPFERIAKRHRTLLKVDLTQGRSIAYSRSSYVIYVAVDENRKPTAVPPLVPADDEERAIVEQARIRRMHRQRIDEELRRGKEK